jgi:hypothetical protein
MRMVRNIAIVVIGGGILVVGIMVLTRLFNEWVSGMVGAF